MTRDVPQEAPRSDDPRGVGALLASAAGRWPERLALRSVRSPNPARDATYAELHDRALRAATRLRAAGVRPGDRVALVAENGLDVVSAWFGITYAGATVVPILILSAASEIAVRLDHSGCRAILFDAERSRIVARVAGDRARLPVEGLGDAGVPTAAGPEETDADAGAMILYTSGTTGHPKGAVISHRTLLAHAEGIGEHALRLTRDDRVLGVLPLAHSYGLRMVLLATFRAGCRAILVRRFDAAATLELARTEAITWIPAVPTMFSAWGALPHGPGVESLRWCLSAGSPLAPEILHRAEGRLGAEIRQGYGMTEATFSTINAPPDERVIDSVGRPAHGVEVRITDSCGNEVPAGETGEVRVRGRNLMTGYLDDAEATREALGDGWMRTGDLGRLDTEGRLYVVDRLKDMIIRGGYNVYPSELEAVLAEHPDVREVAVVGRPDDHFGEEIVALIVPNPGRTPDLATLRAWATEHVARNKMPREWAVLESLPLGPSRKVLKRELRHRIDDGRITTERIG